jgi:hypothetical protein
MRTAKAFDTGNSAPDSPVRMRENAFSDTPATCPTCRVGFQPRRPWQRFCSARCRTAGHKQGNGDNLQSRVVELERRVSELEQALRYARTGPLGRG